MFGEPLNAVSFVLDYLQLQFDAYFLTMLMPVTVVLGEDCLSAADVFWREMSDFTLSCRFILVTTDCSFRNNCSSQRWLLSNNLQSTKVDLIYIAQSVTCTSEPSH